MKACHVIICHPSERSHLGRDLEYRGETPKIMGIELPEVRLISRRVEAEGLRFTSYSITRYAEHELLRDGADARELRDVIYVLTRTIHQKTRYAHLMPWGGEKYGNNVVVAGEQVRSSREAEKQTLITTIRKVVERATGGKLKVDEHHDVHLDQLTFTATFIPDEFGPMVMY